MCFTKKTKISSQSSFTLQPFQWPQEGASTKENNCTGPCMLLKMHSHKHAHMCVSAHTNTRVHTCMLTYRNIHMLIHFTHGFTQSCMYTHMFIPVHMCTCMHTHTCAHSACVHMHSHVCSHKSTHPFVSHIYECLCAHT